MTLAKAITVGTLALCGSASVLLGTPVAQATTTASLQSTGNAQFANCDIVWSAHDPDEGAGAGYSYCWTPYNVPRHRIILRCHYGGDAYGDWAAPHENSYTTCNSGSGAYDAEISYSG